MSLKPEPYIIEIPAPLVVEFWYLDKEKENHLICSGFCHSVADNIRHVNFLDEVERPDKRGLTAEAFEDWDSELIDFTTPFWKDIKWFNAFTSRRMMSSEIKDKDEYQQTWRKTLVSVRYSPYPIRYPV